MMTCARMQKHIHTHTRTRTHTAKQKGSMSLDRLKKVCVYKVLPAAPRGGNPTMSLVSLSLHLLSFSAYTY